MKKLLFPVTLLAMTLLFGGCLVTPVAKTGGPGAITIMNTNPTAIISAAQNIFPNYGYTPGPVSYPDSISFDKPAGGFDKALYGSYGVSTSLRVRITMLQLQGTNNYRVSTRVLRVSDAGEVGFESSQKMLGLWSGQFGPLLKQVNAQAANAGQGY
ncbi:MAG: hypothetical protein ABIP97_09040 [Chthoniobacterales bacterium]